MKDPIKEYFKFHRIVSYNKKVFKLNFFQIDNIKLKSIFLIDQNTKQKHFIDEKINLFSDIDQNILRQNHILQFGIDIEVIPFGKFKFDNNPEHDVNLKTDFPRSLDEKGNITVYLKGI